MAIKKTGKPAKPEKKQEKILKPIPPSRMSTVIRESLERIDKNLDQAKDPSEPWKKIRKVFKKSDKEKILEIAFENLNSNAEELRPYQAELIKLQKHLERTGKKIIILFDGRDASGKGGTIRRVTRFMNAKHYRVVALGKPSQVQRTELYMKRYIEHFPHSGEIVLFDRSWYNRALGPGQTAADRPQARNGTARMNTHFPDFRNPASSASRAGSWMKRP